MEFFSVDANLRLATEETKTRTKGDQNLDRANNVCAVLAPPTTVSLTFGDGITENASMMRSGYSSLTFEMSNVPIPEPVPPPREWHNWKPCKQSQPSASLRTTSKTLSINSAPSV